MHRFLLVFVLLLTSLPTPAQVRPPTQINVGGVNNNGPNRTDGIGVAARGQRVFVAWAEQGGTSEMTQDIHVSVSDDEGASWMAPVRVDTGEPAHLSDSEQPQVLVLEDGTLIVAFEDSREATRQGAAPTEDLLFNRSATGGTSWLPQAIELNGPTAGNHVASDVDHPWLAQAGARVYAVWEEDTGSGSFGPEDLWFNRSLDGGVSWDTARVIGVAGSGVDVDHPKVAAAGSQVVVCCVDDSSGSDDVWVLTSSDAGASFGRTLIETQSAGDVDDAVLAMDGELVAVAWLDDEPQHAGEDAVHVTVSTDGGVSFGPEVSLTPSVEALAGASAFALSVAVRGEQVVVLSIDDAEDVAQGGSGGANAGRAKVAASQDGGATWSVEINLDPGTANTHRRPMVVASDDRFYVHLESGVAGAGRVVYSLSPDGGQNWAQPVEPPGLFSDVDGADLREGPFFAATSGAALSAFWDQTTGTNEIWLSGLGHEPLLIRYCDAAPNSTGVPARLSATGSHWLADQDLELTVEGAPDHPGIFLGGGVQHHFPLGNGTLCIRPPLHWIWPPRVPQGGFLQHRIDFSAMGIVGGRWNFQYWYRDPTAGAAHYSLSDAVSVWFQ